jgi:hypothetical protein
LLQKGAVFSGLAAAQAVIAAERGGHTWTFGTASDTILAAFVASDAETADSHYKPYYNTLPPTSSFDTLPRRWSEAELFSLLAGCTSLIAKAQHEREALIADYALLCLFWDDGVTLAAAGAAGAAAAVAAAGAGARAAAGNAAGAGAGAGYSGSSNVGARDNVHCNSHVPPPSMAMFDWAHAIIGSRAFIIETSEGDDELLVPMVDMVNHRRPRGTRCVIFAFC